MVRKRGELAGAAFSGAGAGAGRSGDLEYHECVLWRDMKRDGAGGSEPGGSASAAGKKDPVWLIT